MEKQFLSGGRALGEAALRAGCRFYAAGGADARSQTAAYLAGRMPRVKGSFLLAEDQAGAISMLMGAAAAGARALTSGAGSGISLMQDGLSHLAAQELPAVVADFSRGGPGMGIQDDPVGRFMGAPAGPAPCQGDYFQATRGGGHGDYRCLVMAPSTCQELADMAFASFGLARRFRNPVLILADDLLERQEDEIALPDAVRLQDEPEPDWVLSGADERARRIIVSSRASAKEQEAHNHKLMRKYEAMARELTGWESLQCEDAQIVVAAFGSAAPIALQGIEKVRARGVRAGLFRPKTLWPFPSRVLAGLAEKAGRVLVFELNTGQMRDDVSLAVKGRAQVKFYGRPGGAIPSAGDLAHQLTQYYYSAGLDRLQA